jgi:YcaO-like protein with predicted kinase domain
MKPDAHTLAPVHQNDQQVVKGYVNGTHRLISPANTFARVKPFFPVMGITRVANVTGLDSIGIPVVVVARPNSRSLAVSQGKGLDLDSARASAVMESVEAYHAERITLPLKLGSYEELRYSHRLVDVDELPRTDASRFHVNLPLLWIEGRDLLNHEPVWVPYELVHTNYTFELRIGAGSFATTSNGLASGNHLLEASGHAICEVVERDATTLWYLRGERGRQNTRIDLDTVDDPACRQVLEKYERAGIAVAVWETTSDVGIPAFLCTITEEQENPLRLLYSTNGMGCHPDRSISLLRALTEAAQSRLTAIAGSRDDLFPEDYQRYRSPDVLRRNRESMMVTGPMRHFRDGPDYQSRTFDEDLAWSLDHLKTVGIERVVAIDLSKAEFRLPVVRVVIPGLEGVGSLHGYLPGRRARTILEQSA